MSTPMSEYNEILRFKSVTKLPLQEKNRQLIRENERVKSENPFAASIGIQMIIVIFIVIAMLCLNTFLREEYEDIERFLSAQLAFDVNWHELFYMVKTSIGL